MMYKISLRYLFKKYVEINDQTGRGGTVIFEPLLTNINLISVTNTLSDFER